MRPASRSSARPVKNPRGLTAPLVLTGAGGYSPPELSLRNVVQGAGVNFSTMSLAANGTQNGFKGRRMYRMAAGADALPWIRFGLYNWRVNGSNGAGVTEVAGTTQLQVNKAYVVLRNAALTQRGNGVAATYGGARAFTIPATTAIFRFDQMTPTQFGVQQFAAGDFLEWRWWFTLATGDNAYRMVTVWASQGWRFNEANLVDDIDSAAVMTVGAGTSLQPITFPNVVEGNSFVNSYAILGDSISYRQNSISNSTDAMVGESYATKAAWAAGVASWNCSIGGRTTRGILNSPLTLAAVRAHCNCALLATSANDIAFGTTSSTLDADYRELIALVKGYGFSRIGASNALPRTTEGVSNSTNLYLCTDLTQMVPYITAAVTPVAGYGFGAGETRDQWNSTTLPAMLADGTINFINDIATIAQDPTTTWKWKVPAYSSTLSSGVSAGASTISVAASPPLGTNLVIETGVANVENKAAQGGPLPFSVSGSGPFTVTVTYTNSYSGVAGQGVVILNTHSSAVAVKATLSSDGTHPNTSVHDDVALVLSPLLVA